MRVDEAFSYMFLPPTAILGLTDTFVQVKIGAGILRFVWVMDDLFPSGASFSVWDGVLGPPQTPGLPPSVSGTVIFPSANGCLGPMNARFKTGLVVQYTNNQPQASGFVSYR